MHCRELEVAEASREETMHGLSERVQHLSEAIHSDSIRKHDSEPLRTFFLCIAHVVRCSELFSGAEATRATHSGNNFRRGMRGRTRNAADRFSRICRNSATRAKRGRR